MGMDLFELLPPGSPDWFPAVRADLSAAWRQRRGNEPETALACRLANPADGTGHLSLPCSLANDDGTIEEFLGGASLDENPPRFLRLFLFLLDDFVESLQRAYKFAGTKNPPRAPDLISIWTNRFAKHRQNVLILHHPTYLFLDHPTAGPWHDAAQKAQNLTIVDTDWLKARSSNPDAQALGVNQNPSIIQVPKLRDFLDGALVFYDGFVNECAKTPAVLKGFETPDHELSLKTLFERLIPHLPKDLTEAQADPP